MNVSEAILAAHHLQRLRLLRPDFQARLTRSQFSALNWIIENHPLSLFSSSEVEKIQELPSNWLNNYSAPLEIAQNITETLPKIQGRVEDNPSTETKFPNPEKSLDSLENTITKENNKIISDLESKLHQHEAPAPEQFPTAKTSTESNTRSTAMSNIVQPATTEKQPTLFTQEQLQSFVTAFMSAMNLKPAPQHAQSSTTDGKFRESELG